MEHRASKAKTLADAYRAILLCAKGIAILISRYAFSRIRIVVLETAGKGKYDRRIVPSLETQEIVSVNIR